MIISLATWRVRWPIAASGAARGRTEREAVIVELRTDDGRIGRGEAAPLPGWSRDTLDDAQRALDAIALPFDTPPQLASRAAQFALETALLFDAPDPPIETAYVVDAPADIPPGATHLKIKIAPDHLDHVRAIHAAAPHARLRLDGNRTFANDAVPALLARFADLPVEYFEEPSPDARGPTIALDESLPAPCAIAVIKPTVIDPRTVDAPVKIISHALEGPIGMRGVRAVARAHPGRVHGIAPQRPLIQPILASEVARIVGLVRAELPVAPIHAGATPTEQARQRGLVEAAAAHLPDDTAAILFTSGSTGVPRGVVLSRAALAAAARAHAAHMPWQPGDAWHLALSLAHAGGLAIVVRCLAAGIPIVDDLADATITSLVPTQLAQLLADPAWTPPPRLRAILLGGAAAPPALIEHALARGAPVLQTYGMTETFGQVATALVPGGPLALLPGVAISGSPLAIDAPMLATAYLEPDGTLTPIARPFVTRDLGTTTPALAIHGRADDVIITGGENVHPTTVEAALAPLAAIAFGVPDARWGEVVAVAIAAPPRFDLARAAAAWHAALPPHARPRRVALVSALPLLPTGKLDRAAARALPTRPIEYAVS